MKQFKTPSFLTAILIAFAMLFASCKKETITNNIETPSPLKSEAVIIYFGKTNTFTGCVPDRFGFCIAWEKLSRNNWANYNLQEDEGKGEVWASDLGNSESELTMYAGTVKISKRLSDSIKHTNTYPIEEDTYLPKDLVAAAFKNAGISTVPEDLKITKGTYPVTFTNQPLTPDPAVNKWVITIKWKWTSDGRIITSITIRWVEP